MQTGLTRMPPVDNMCCAAFARYLAVLVLVAVSGCGSIADTFSSPVAGLPAPVDKWAIPNATELSKFGDPGVDAQYRIGPRDELTITVWGYPDLGSQVPVERDSRRNISIVQDNGSVSLPFLGAVGVSGRTVEEVRSMIERLYRRNVPGAQVDVVVASHLSKMVLLEGEFVREGRIFLSNNTRTIEDAVAFAGGLTQNADQSRGILVRGGREYRFDYRSSEEGSDAAHRVLLDGGDRIYIPKASDRRVYIFGEVGQQGVFTIPSKGLSLVEALATAGGPDVITADGRGIYLVRNENQESSVYKLSIVEALEAPDVPLQDGDRIYVASTGLARWDRFWRQALPFFTTTFAASGTASNVNDTQNGF